MPTRQYTQIDHDQSDQGTRETCQAPPSVEGSHYGATVQLFHCYSLRIDGDVAEVACQSKNK